MSARTIDLQNRLNLNGNNLDSGRVANESGGHLESPWWDVTDSGLHVVRDPLDEVAAVLVLDVQHLLIHLSKEEEKRYKMDSFGFFLTSFIDMRPRNTAATVR